MKRKLVALGIASIAAILLFAVTVTPALHAISKPEITKIPFVGMSMVYYANTNFNYDSFKMGNFLCRPVVVLKYYPETNSVLIRDENSWMLVYVENREVYWATGWMEQWVPFTVEYWIPTNVKIGSHVNTGGLDAVVTGSKVLSVEGKSVDCWQLYAAGTGWQDTWYYEKRTGLWIAASWVQWDEDGTLLNSWGGHLASTNVAL